MSGLPVLLFLDISGGELLVIMLVVFLVFGPDKMPEMARKAGRFMNQLKKASNDLTREFKKETAVFENEVNTVQKKVTDQVESVSREIIRTKKQVVSDLSIETESEKPKASPALSAEVPDESETAKDEVKTENTSTAATE
jgi:sec-independent protein translocase protein TatA